MNSFSSLRLPVIGGAVLLMLLAGCARERVGAPGLSEGVRPVTGSGMGSSVRTTDEQLAAGKLPDAVLKLEDREEKAFSRTGELDAGMNAAETRQVKYHFIKYARERRATMAKYLRNGIPYINYSRTVFKSRGMPAELAYLAYLESGYNPLAVSSSKAVGMWQFMAPTGRQYGLRQDWWVDERMDPVKSTDAAAQYLSRLYSIFHDWHLAIASYNGGEGKIGRAKNATGAGSLHEIITKNGTLSYDMQLREETRLYVPRFLAITKIMRDPETLGIRPAAPDASHPVIVPFVGLKAKPATDLVELARRLGMTWKEFLCYNPQFLRSVSPAGRESTVYVPRTREQQARSLLESSFSGAGWTYYTVRRKDTAARVSEATGVPASVIAELNPGALTEGRRLRVPARAGSVSPARTASSISAAVSDNPYDHASAALAELEQISAAPSDAARARKASKNASAGPRAEKGAGPEARPSVHIVKQGETATAIARRYGIGLKDLAAANGGMSRLETITIGAQLKIPGNAGLPAVREEKTNSRPPAASKEVNPAASAARTAPEKQAPPPSASSAKGQASSVAPLALPATHTVRAGETVSGIARMYGISFGALCAANGGMDKLNVISVGKVLNLPRENSPGRGEPSPAAPSSGSVKAGAAPVKAEDVNASARTGGALPARSLPAPSTGNGGSSSASAGKGSSGKEVSAAAPSAERPAGTGNTKPADGPVPETYSVQPGDTVWSIARRFGLSPVKILSANGMDESVRLRTGDTIRLKK